ncbi:MAG: hypothetical protein FRX49_01366 [Trebouxia sp. A1-2]|nr:MAG: hypothetical protein FRX49_01366 [Trebouxia sp. A1-2]
MSSPHAHPHLPAIQAAATATAQAVVLQPSLGLAAPSTGWLSDSVKIMERVLSLLKTYGALKVSQNLHTLGYPEVVAQRACLEVHMVTKTVDVDSCVKWINQQPDLNSVSRPMNPLDLLKYQDLTQAVTNLLHRVPSINQQTAQIAIQQTLGDEDAAAAFLNAAMSKSHMPTSGDPNTMASLLLQNLPPGFNLPANSGEVVQAMAAAMAKASELQLATDRLAVAAIQSQQQIKAAMVSGHLTAISAPSEAQQPLEEPGQQANASSAESWQKERKGMVETVEVLEKHKDWADKKIGQLIKRVTEAERPQKDEAYRLRDEVHKLRQEKDVLESKLKEFERSLQKLKDCTYQEATQKRDYERRLQALLADHRAVQADLRGASLREQELQLQVEHEACSAKTERKRRETLERASKQAVEDKASVVSTLAEHGQQVAQLQAAARRQERLADERLLRAEHQIAAMAQARRELDNKCEVLTAEKASMASGLEAKDVQMESMQQEHSNVQTQLVLCQERVSQLQTELMQTQQALAAKDQQTSFYSHWNGGALFDGGDIRSPTSTSPPTPLAIHPNPPASIASSQEGARSPVHHTTAQANLQNALGSVVESLRSPTQTRTQPDQPTSLIQSRIGGRSPIQHASPGVQLGMVQSPIGSQVMHRKSNSVDSGRVPSPSPLHGFSHQAGGNPRGPTRGGRLSSRPQHAQQATAIPPGDGPIASLLGLNGSRGLRAEGNMRSLRPSKSLQHGGAGGRHNTSMNEHIISSFLPKGILDSEDGSNLGMPWVQQQTSNPEQMNHGDGFSYTGNQGMAQHSNAFQRQLHIANAGHLNL